LPIDIDPIRPAGIPSTDQEHDAAINLAHKLSADLETQGWPAGIILDSGNGAQILYRIDLPNDEHSASLTERVLKGLARQCNNAVLEVDVKVFNASRIWKLPGTMAVKGDATAERPHRLARAVRSASAQTLTTEQLTAVAIPVEKSHDKQRGRNRHRSDFNLDALLSSYGDDYKKSPWKGGAKYVFETCPNDPTHKRTFCVTQQPNGGGISARCLHASCGAFNWFAYRELRELGFEATGKNRSAPEPVNDDAISDSERAGLPPEFSDDALALSFADDYADNLRYTDSLGKWHRWTGQRWLRDETLVVFDLARIVARNAASKCVENPSLGRQTAKASTVAAIERLARADRRHAMTVEEWDADPWKLNTPSGIVDLKTGEVSEHRREDFCTKITGARVADQPPRLWLGFLDRVTDGDPELQAFLRRMFGYALTGITTEHALFFLYGTGKNGKSVFISTISGIAGEYARSAPIETFTASNNDQHPTDRAGLLGARLVTAVEVEHGRRWAESKIKNLTGGDKISARLMRQDFFEYIPQFKLIIAGNHKPRLRSVDEAMRRRLHLVPFTVTITEKERDRDLPEKLKTEWPAILRWGIEGCLEWQREGLNPPKRVRATTEEYFAAEDLLGRWLEERTIQGPRYSTSSSVLYKDWKRWTEERNEHTGSNKDFSQHLQARGFEIELTRAANMFKGLALLEEVKA